MFRCETIAKNPEIWTDKQWWIYNVRCGIKRYRLSDKKLNGDQMECSQRKQKSAMDLHNELTNDIKKYSVKRIKNKLYIV